MALDVGSVYARLGARVDDDGFDRFERRLEATRRDARNGIEANLRADVDTRGFRRFGASLTDATNDAERSSGRIRGALRTLGPAMGAAAVAGGGAAAFLGKKFLDSATDIAESQSKLKTVLGDSASVIEDFSRSSATSLGISRQEALRASGDFASFFSLLGRSRPQAAGMAVEMTKLAADLASFNNASPEEALIALGAGLRGEAEPLRRFNVLLDDATLRQRAVKDGLIATTKEALTPQQKALAAYGVILEQTKTQQGDFARTSGGLANQQRILRARISDVGAELGAKLMPAALNAVEGLNNLITSMQNGDFQASQFGKGVARAGDIAAGAFSVVKTAGGAVVDVMRFVVNATGDVIRAYERGELAAVSLVSGIGGVVAAFVGFKAAAGIVAAVTSAIGKLKGALTLLRANPLILVATAVGALIGVLAGLSARQKDAAETARDHADALRDVKNAAANVQDAELALREARTAQRAAALGVERAEREVSRHRKKGTQDTLAGREAEQNLRSARDNQKRTAFELSRAEDRVARDRGTLRKETEKANDAGIKHNETTRNDIENKRKLIEAQEKAIDKLDKTTLSTDDYTAAVRRHRRRIADLKAEIDGLENKAVKVDVSINLSGETIRRRTRPDGQGDGWGIEAGVRQTAQAGVDAFSTSDLLGALGTGLGGAPIGGSGLNAFNHLAPLFGVRVGSGIRPGAITESGNVSLHALGRARDFPGPPEAMMAFARFMVSTYGTRLKELIYTPLGFAIKNGRRVAPYAQADHYDHVHVGMQRGGNVPGVGDGDKIPALLEPGEYVVNKKATAAALPFLDALNYGISRFQTGGLATARAERDARRRAAAQARSRRRLARRQSNLMASLRETGMTPGENRGLDRLESSLDIAELTPVFEGPGEDIEVATKIVGAWERAYKRRQKEKRGVGIRGRAASGLKNARDELQRILDDAKAPAADDPASPENAADPGPSPFEQAQAANSAAIAEQATRRAAALEADLAAARSNFAAFTGSGDLGFGGNSAYAALIGSLGPVGRSSLPGAPGPIAGMAGGGNVTINVRSFMPPTGRQARELAETVAVALDAQPYRTPTREVVR